MQPNINYCQSNFFFPFHCDRSSVYWVQVCKFKRFVYLKMLCVSSGYLDPLKSNLTLYLSFCLGSLIDLLYYCPVFSSIILIMDFTYLLIYYRQGHCANRIVVINFPSIRYLVFLRSINFSKKNFLRHFQTA